MTTTIQRWGNSQGIRIPKVLIDTVNWKENEELSVRVKDNKIIIEKASRPKTIQELFADYKEAYVPVQIDWGEPVGNEIW